MASSYNIHVQSYSVAALANCVIIVSRECALVLVETRARSRMRFKRKVHARCVLIRDISHFTGTDGDHDNDNDDSLCEWLCFVRESHARFFFSIVRCLSVEDGRRGFQTAVSAHLS